MKRLIATSLSVMFLFAISNPANAQTRHGKEASISQTVQDNLSNTSRKLKPFHLVFLGYQGYLKNQGISSYAGFISESHQMNFYGRDLVKAGIDAKLLPAETLTNREYINAVNNELMSFYSGS
ncbi:hypothetical protein DSM106972_028010 [Dulcicalothrix desertica PCC 7102]|uniref:Uncharacterized protein n=1 Tax=Dulcicalothrix desertica PCC 7102 TaxID=232991 RepID=A0A433VKA8_9CYAN|nr:hypothetical protein [Dulcicalothrix desertica]RUT06544.1 hypothetical protein DSM106972_028010 [Dulcicalothrix desertica PCC 7102]TWH50341.1 hypothetical protein CAL7102_04640 [Dulcicalothrix desertica PCC 7102]